MIRQHDFNSHWWGAPVGVIDDPGFFDLDTDAQDKALQPYAWVEFSADADLIPTGEKLVRAGFFCADMQIHFRINLAKIASSPSIDRLSVSNARETTFEIPEDELRDFAHERFLHLSEGTPQRINRRYALWSKELIRQHPDCCLQISDGGKVQGWFLAELNPGKPLRLTLAMLKSDARISGQLLYQKALLEYAARGSRIGEASFSVTNTAVMNIYSSLGARFLAPKSHWLRTTGDNSRNQV